MSGLLISERITFFKPKLCLLTLIVENPCRFQLTHLQLTLDAWWLYLSKQQEVTTNDNECSFHTDYKLVFVHVHVCVCVCTAVYHPQHAIHTVH